MNKKLNELLLAQGRLSIMAFLLQVQEADFVNIQTITSISSGNLSIQLNKLKKAGYIEVNKQFKGNYPQTICKITKKGIEALTDFFEVIDSYKQPLRKETDGA